MLPGDEENQEDADEPEGSTPDELTFLVERQRDLLTAIATGTSITAANASTYRRRRRKIKQALARFEVQDPFPWPDLYQWWGYCARPRFHTYQERRNFLAEVTEPVVERLEALKSAVTDWVEEDGEEATSWGTLEARLSGLKKEFRAAATRDDLQDVGRRAREIMIDAAALVFDDAMVPEGEDLPRRGDAKNRLDYYIQARMPGESHAELRRLIRAAWDLSNAVTHSNSLTRSEAFASAQATVLLVRSLEKIEDEAGE